jgi:hypothetical protein
MADLQALQALGFEWPSPAYLFGALLFGLLGMLAWRRGRVLARPRTRWLGLALMLYPYLVSSTWVLWATGAALCAGVMLDSRPDAE